MPKQLPLTLKLLLFCSAELLQLPVEVKTESARLAEQGRLERLKIRMLVSPEEKKDKMGFISTEFG